MINENKYRLLKKALKKAMKQWDDHPLSNSAKSEYLLAKQNMIDYYNEIVFDVDYFTLSSAEKQT